MKVKLFKRVKERREERKFINNALLLRKKENIEVENLNGFQFAIDEDCLKCYFVNIKGLRWLKASKPRFWRLNFSF